MFNKIVHLNEGYLHGKSLRPPMCAQRRLGTPYVFPKKSSETLAVNFRSAYTFHRLCFSLTLFCFATLLEVISSKVLN